MSIFLDLVEEMKQNNFTYVTCSTVWDAHNTNLRSKKTNVYKAISGLPQLSATECYIAIVGKRGRSAHSASNVHIFKGAVSNIDTLNIWRDYEVFYSDFSTD